jgi:hypothetical protein
VLAQLAKLQADAKKPPRSLEWNPLRVKLLLGGEGERPGVGYWVSIEGRLYKEEKQSVSKKSTTTGLVDFGLVRPGRYSVRVTTPWIASSPTEYGPKFVSNHIVVVEPGSEKELTFRVPEKAVVKTDVRLRVDLPADLQKRGVTAYIQFHAPVQNIKGSSQTYQYSRSGPVVHYLTEKTQHYRYENASNVQTSSFTRNPFYGSLQLQDFEQIPTSRRASPSWVTAEYGIEAILLLIPSTERYRGGGFNIEKRYYVVDQVYFDKPVTFSPQAGKQNVWKIALPPKLIESARKRLKTWNDGQPTTPLSAASDEFLKKLAATGTGFDSLPVADKGDYVTQVRYYFSIMDANKDGNLQESEWDASKRIKPAFAKAKIDLTKNMTERDFVLNYIRVFLPGKQNQPAKQP